MDDKSYQSNNKTASRSAQRVFLFRIVYTKASGILCTGFVSQPSFAEAARVIFSKYYGSRIVFVGMEGL